jgi:Tfp pilus assembly protein PilV
MIEAMIAVVLIAVCAGTVLAVSAAVEHQRARQRPTAALSLSAQNVLTDLRAATAYDPAELADLVGRSISFSAIEPGPGGAAQTLQVSVTLRPTATAGLVAAAVTVQNAAGQTATMGSTLAAEVPAPGSVVAGQTPASTLTTPR